MQKNSLRHLKQQEVNNMSIFRLDGKVALITGGSYGIGFGIDGYCCEVGDRLKAESKEKINYSSIAVNGILFHFKKVSGALLPTLGLG